MQICRNPKEESSTIFSCATSTKMCEIYSIARVTLQLVRERCGLFARGSNVRDFIVFIGVGHNCVRVHISVPFGRP
jgi:hypothetical protein